jgi:hypothetical protein
MQQKIKLRRRIKRRRRTDQGPVMGFEYDFLGYGFALRRRLELEILGHLTWFMVNGKLGGLYPQGVHKGSIQHGTAFWEGHGIRSISFSDRRYIERCISFEE